MAKASDISLTGNNSFLFKGPFGFGKTLAAASFALEGPIWISYWDKKSPVELNFFKRFGEVGQKILDNIDYDVYSSINANDYLNKLIELSRDCRYVACVNDSLTFMTSAAVNWSLNFGSNPNVTKKIKDILPDWDEYKVETSLVSQCVDICKKLPCHTIWTAHPLPTTKVEGGGSSMKVTKVNSLVSYGSKVAAMVPGGFTEIYHFSQETNWNSEAQKSTKRYVAQLDTIGDEFAKTALFDNSDIKSIDFTDRLFYQVWKEKLEELNNKQKEQIVT